MKFKNNITSVSLEIALSDCPEWLRTEAVSVRTCEGAATDDNTTVKIIAEIALDGDMMVIGCYADIETYYSDGADGESFYFQPSETELAEITQAVFERCRYINGIANEVYSKPAIAV